MSFWSMNIVVVFLFAAVNAEAQVSTSFSFSQRGSYRFQLLKSQVIDPYIQTQQGYNLRVWLGSDATIGEQAFIDGKPPNNIGCEYPINSGIEHLYGAGVWIGAIVDTGGGQPIYAVTTGYDWGAEGPRHEMFGHQTARDTFFHTSILDTHSPNLKGVDDDGDGKIDEDELDGYDNDGDWNPLTDDIGADGIPDSLEVGCKGAYDPVRNPDPAFDNYDVGGTRLDSCRPDPNTGKFPKKIDKNIYTEKNGIPDHGEPHVDEDYGAVSESDVYVSYSDIFQQPTVTGHIPLGIKVFQKSYAWRTAVKEPFVIMEYNIKNVGRRTLDSVYIGFFVDPLVGLFQIPDITVHKYAGYFPELRTGYANNAFDRPSTPIGLTVLGTSKPLSSLRYSFTWNLFSDNPGTDYEHYQRMSSGQIKPDQPFTDGEDTQFLFSFGPFESLQPSDSLKVTFALVSGDGVEAGNSPLKTNAAKAIELFNNGYRLPAVPPSPPLRVTTGDKNIHLNWKWRQGDPLYDPIETWDDSDKFVESLPPTHWRRVNPPAGKTHGGRIFEGYKLWRSESPEFVPSSFTLLKQYDVIDDLNFEFGTGIQYDFVDSNLEIGKTYWYAVTSFSIPRISVITVPDPNGGLPKEDTVVSRYGESDLSENAKKVQLPFSPSTKLGEVKVVPNPYRSDVDYTFEQGGWEGRAQFWTENQRVIWFTHLPARATIRIFSLTGDIVATLVHDDVMRASSNRAEGQEEWNLLSDSGRAIASGIYVFAVESEYGKQVGKFAVIR